MAALDGGKLGALLEYKRPANGRFGREALEEVCKLYLDDDAVVGRVGQRLGELCEKLAGRTVDEVRRALLEEGDEQGGELAKLLRDNAAAAAAKPVSSALSSLLEEDLAEDDDADEDADEDDAEDAPKKPKIEPVMRGVVEQKDGRVVWSGKWAMSKDKFAAGEKSKFKCVYAGKCDAFDAAKPPSGRYTGYFIVQEPGTPKIRVDEKQTTITFAADGAEEGFLSVTGKGTNQFGEFTLSGMYAKSGGRLSVVKTYKPRDLDFEADDDDDDDDDIDDDDDPDAAAAELADLKADAEEDIELLRKRKMERDAAMHKKKPKT